MKEPRKRKSPPQAKSPVELTPAEWEIMKVVWEKQPCMAGTVRERLAESRCRAYSTVKTTMDRMVEKGLLKIEGIRNLKLFSSCISAAVMRMDVPVKRRWDHSGNPPMQKTERPFPLPLFSPPPSGTVGR